MFRCKYILSLQQFFTLKNNTYSSGKNCFLIQIINSPIHYQRLPGKLIIISALIN